MIKIDIILNVIIGMFLYSIVIKAIASTMIKYIVNSKPMKETNKSFKEELKKKLKENE